jgi:hypothetical protein
VKGAPGQSSASMTVTPSVAEVSVVPWCQVSDAAAELNLWFEVRLGGRLKAEGACKPDAVVGYVDEFGDHNDQDPPFTAGRPATLTIRVIDGENRPVPRLDGTVALAVYAQRADRIEVGGMTLKSTMRVTGRDYELVDYVDKLFAAPGRLTMDIPATGGDLLLLGSLEGATPRKGGGHTLSLDSEVVTSGSSQTEASGSQGGAESGWGFRLTPVSGQDPQTAALEWTGEGSGRAVVAYYSPVG